MSAKGSKVEDVMEREVVICFPKATVKEVSELMRDVDSKYCCVVDPDSRALIGILTETDFVPKFDRLPHTRDVEAYHFFGEYFSLNTPISEIYTRVSGIAVERGMTKGVITLKPSDDQCDALKLMAKKRLRRIPVTDRNRCLLGIVTSQALSSARFQ